MARTRSIKPGFFDNDVLGGLSPLTRLLFIGLWCIADREGRLEDRPGKIKKVLLGYDAVDSNGVDAMLQALHDTEFICRYATENGAYIQVTNFSKHQYPHLKERESTIPPPPPRADLPDTSTGFAPDLTDTSTGFAPDKTGTCTEQARPLNLLTSLPCTGVKNKTLDHSATDVAESVVHLHPQQQTPAAKPAARKQAAPAPSPWGFDEFWDFYPRKVAKKAAEKAWRKIDLTDELLDRILDAVEDACNSEQWRRDNGRYIPHPATWLNQERWEDVEDPKEDGEPVYGPNYVNYNLLPEVWERKMREFREAGEKVGPDHWKR